MINTLPSCTVHAHTCTNTQAHLNANVCGLHTHALTHTLTHACTYVPWWTSDYLHNSITSRVNHNRSHVTGILTWAHCNLYVYKRKVIMTWTHHNCSTAKPAVLKLCSVNRKNVSLNQILPNLNHLSIRESFTCLEKQFYKSASLETCTTLGRLQLNTIGLFDAIQLLCNDKGVTVWGSLHKPGYFITVRWWLLPAIGVNGWLVRV